MAFAHQKPHSLMKALQTGEEIRRFRDTPLATGQALLEEIC